MKQALVGSSDQGISGAGAGSGLLPCHHVWEYRYAYGALEPVIVESFFLIMPSCDTACMNVFLKRLSEQFPEDSILICCNRAS